MWTASTGGGKVRHSPVRWLKENNFSSGFWTYFTASLFFDAGFCIYYFIFNLYLLDLHFNERFIGLVSGAVTVGSIVMMLPAGILSRLIGLRKLLILCYLFSPLIHVARAVWMWPPAQFGLAVLGGMALSTSGVCYLPAVARLTTEKNRTAAFSLIFSASLASSAVGGLICGYIPKWLQHSGISMPSAELERLILIVSCAVALLAVLPATRLRLPDTADVQALNTRQERGFRFSTVSPTVMRLLVPLTLWAVVLATFYPFGNVYLSAHLHLPLEKISFIFSTVQVVQICLLVATPIVLRAMGLLNGLLAIEISTGIVLGVLALMRHAGAAIPLFLLFTALQWMVTPGLYDLMMTSAPDAERESAAALMLFCNAVVSAVTTSCAGVLYTRFGYRGPMLGLAVLTLIVAVLSRILLNPLNGPAARKKKFRNALQWS